MPVKNKWRLNVEATAETPLDQTRSVYGDGHAATDHAMLAAHARHLQHAEVIDEHMVNEFTKPYKFHVHNVRYTSAYLALHPDYTGEDVDTIPTLQAAMKRQRDEDKAGKKILEDYRAGHIDIWGNRTGITMAGGDRGSTSHVQGGRRQHGISRAYEGQRLSPRGKQNTFEIAEADESSSDDSVARAPVRRKRRDSRPQKGSTEAVIPNTSTSVANLPAKGNFPTAVPLPFKKRIAQFRYDPDLLPSGIPPPTTPQLNRPLRKDSSRTSYDGASGTSPNKTLTVASSRPLPSPQRSRQSRTVTPLQPSPGNSDYTELEYYKAAALCRKRGIPSGGNVQGVRNHLIRDDTAVREGLPRAMASTNYRKRYTTVAPGDGEVGY